MRRYLRLVLLLLKNAMDKCLTTFQQFFVEDQESEFKTKQTAKSVNIMSIQMN